MRDVPTSTPIPMVEINRSCEEDKVIDNGNAPARNELSVYLAEALSYHSELHLRQCHHHAQHEQHK
jgi:hypothetical protein